MDELKILIGIVVSLFGWVVAHRFTSRRDLENKKRETKINLIVKSYENISLWMSEPSGGETLKDLVNALILVQCFGSQYQTEKAKDALKSISESEDHVAGLGDLLMSLRDDFRKELNLAKDQDTVATVHLRKS